MTSPVRLRLSRHKGFDLQAWSRAANGLEAVNCARPGPWGNPYRVGESVDIRQARRWGWRLAHPEFVCPDAETAVKRFAASLGLDDASICAVRMRLGGRNLACWCELDDPWCHCDPILRIANAAPHGAAK